MFDKKLTIKELEELNKKLEKLKSIERPKIIKEISNSKLLGDLSENSEYHSAKKKKYLIDLKIREIENILSNCEIIKNKKELFFSKIKLQNIKNNEILEYKIINNKEEYNKNYISIESPLFKLIKDKNVNDLISIKKYNKEIIFKILLKE